MEESHQVAKRVDTAVGATPRKVHRLRFLKQQIYPVRCLKWEPKLKRLAVSRSEGSIEIWGFHPDPSRSITCCCWFVERRIPGALGRRTESLIWCRRRLFAAGTSGLLLEFDAAFNVTREIPALAGGVVAIAANEKLGKIALASMDGTIIVYDVMSEGLVYDKTMEKRRERIISLAWHENGDTLVTGCKGHILIWDFSSGRVRSHIPLAKVLTKRKGKRGKLSQKAVLVWVVECLVDGTLVTGDSNGTTSFWDLNTSTLKFQLKTHDGPILALCVANDEQTVWGSGVDPRVIEIRRNPAAINGWQLGHVNNLVKRDVHALAYVHGSGFTSNGFVFGGDDPRLYVTRVWRDVWRDDKVLDVHKDGSRLTANASLTPAPANVSSMINLSRKRGILVSRVNRGIEIWRLGSSSNALFPSFAILPLDSSPTKLAVIPGRKGTPDYFTSTAINDDATLLCVSDETQTSIFRLDLPAVSPSERRTAIDDGGGGDCRVTKIKALNGVLSPNFSISHFCSTNEDDLLVALTASGKLEALRIRGAGKKNGANLSFKKMTMPLKSSGLPTCMALRTRRFADGEATLAAIGFSSGRVEVVDVSDGRVVASLPLMKDITVSSVAFSPDGAEVTAVYVNREIAFFTLDSQRTIYWPTVTHDPPNWRSVMKKMMPINGTTYLTPTKLLMHSDIEVYVLDKTVSTTVDGDNEEVVAKKPKLALGGDYDFWFQPIRSFDIVHFVDALENGEMVVAETTVEKLEEKLPEPLLKKKFGT